MVNVTVHTALNIAIAPAHPSINCLRWTADGQILFLTKTAIYILTPDPGVNFDSVSTIKSSVNEKEANVPIGWYKTIIELDKRSFYHWPTDSQDWGTVALGSLDLSLRSVTASPSNLTADAGCILAVINSNLEVSLWRALKNHLKGHWIKLQDATSFLSSIAAARAPFHVQRTLQAQINCASWSAQCDFGIEPAPTYDGSLLALGSRAGTVCLLRYRETSVQYKNHLEHVQTLSVADKWITHLTWLPWTTSGSSQCTAILACGISDGSVSLVEIKETLHVEPGITSFGAKWLSETETFLHPDQSWDTDKSGITGLEWVTPPIRKPILVCVKPGVVNLWSAESTSGPWHGLRSLILRRQALSTSSSSLQPVTGIEYSRKNDALVLSLFDGSFHVIYTVSSEPTLEQPAGSAGASIPSSWNLSSASRSVFAQTEGKTVKMSEINRISGMVSYDGLPTVAWVHEGTSPSDFSYKHEAKHTSSFVVAELWPEDEEPEMIQKMKVTISAVAAASGTAPIHILRPLFSHLLKAEKLAQLHSHILSFLQSGVGDNVVPSFVPAWLGERTDNVRAELRASFERHLFGSNALLSSRLRLATADFCWKYAATPEAQAECGAVAQNLLNGILHRVLHIHIRHLVAIEGLLTENDIAFVYRIVVQSLLKGTPEDLFREAEELRMRLDVAFPDSVNSLAEKCPACGAPVPLDDISIAKCLNGHTWSRCSITSFILATPMVRTCIGCTRKAFIPPLRAAKVKAGETELGAATQAEALNVEHLPQAARSWIVQDLLDAVRRCLFCGNIFVVVI